jgi:RNA polymerase subunit RPABC4/transcription elongation factor Spt4
MLWFFIWLVQAIIALVLCIQIGKEKNRNGVLWGLFLGLFGLLILAILPPLENSIEGSTSSRNSLLPERKCKSCGNIIPPGYSGCPSCGFADPDSTNYPDSLITLNRNKILTVICPYCKASKALNISYNDFVEIKCERCNKKITRENAIFE